MIDQHRNSCMTEKRIKRVFWRRRWLNQKFDIAALRPENLPKGRRFETIEDATAESERSEARLRGIDGKDRFLPVLLHNCRHGDNRCDQPYCPICGRTFRRWLISELLRLTQGRSAQTITLLLEESADLKTLNPKAYHRRLRKRLQRAGFGTTPVIGGYEVVYRAKERHWVLHLHLLAIEVEASAIKKLRQSLNGSQFKRPIVTRPLADRPEQLSYLLKFTTYHRPHQRPDTKRQAPVPLNKREHWQLASWLAQFEFQELLFLFNVRRRGSSIVISGGHDAARQ
jgi:hypothetical protein